MLIAPKHTETCQIGLSVVRIQIGKMREVTPEQYEILSEAGMLYGKGDMCPYCPPNTTKFKSELDALEHLKTHKEAGLMQEAPALAKKEEPKKEETPEQKAWTGEKITDPKCPYCDFVARNQSGEVQTDPAKINFSIRNHIKFKHKDVYERDYKKK